MDSDNSSNTSRLRGNNNFIKKLALEPHITV